MIILEKGCVPHINFSKDELYKVVDKYIHVKVSFNSLVYMPTYTEIKKHYQNNRISLDYLIGSKSHTIYAFELYKQALKDFNVSEQDYYNYLVKVAKKLFYLNNSLEDIFMFFNKFIIEENSDILHLFSQEELLIICQEAEELHFQTPYKPSHKCVVFHPYKEFNSFFKQIICKRELGKLNSSIVLKKSKNRTISEIAKETNLAEITIKKHLNKKGKSTKGVKKNNTIITIQKWRKKHPTKKQKDCQKELNFSQRTIERYWNQK
jgi:hypothetical protein